MFETLEYGNWVVVAVTILIFAFFTLGFIRPKKKLEWRNYSIFTAYLIALFFEMFGFPLTVFLLVTWLGSRYPVSNPYKFIYGHLIYTFFGANETILILIHIISIGLILLALVIMARAWNLIYKSRGNLVDYDIYKYMRHPQYLAIYLIMVAFLIQWPTLITLFMFPILLYMYYRLSLEEEKYLEKQFGDRFVQYKNQTPMFIPKFRSK